MTETRAPVSFFHPSLPNLQTFDIDLALTHRDASLRILISLSFARTFSHDSAHVSLYIAKRKGKKKKKEISFFKHVPDSARFFKKYKAISTKGVSNGNDDRAVEQYRILIFPGKLGYPDAEKADSTIGFRL